MKQCVPCRRGDMPLSPDEMQKKLAALKGWALTEDKKKIFKRWKFKHFKEALAFVNSVSALAEAEDHHPDMAFGWGYAEVTFTTHAIDGLHENDFVMARAIENLSQNNT